MGTYQDTYVDTEMVEDCLAELTEMLVEENKGEVDRYVALFTNNRVRVIDLLTFRRWRGIARGDFLGDLEDDIIRTLTYYQ